MNLAKSNQKILTRLSLLLVSLFLLAGDAWPQKQADSIVHEFVFRNWDNQSGLPQNTVFALAHDHAGYLWGGTEEGLFRFDGAQFTLINEGNTPGLHSGTFYTIFTSGEDLWASSRNSIVRIREKVEQIIDFQDYAAGGWITSIARDTSGMLWIGTSNGRLFYLAGDTILPCKQWDTSAGGSIESMKYSNGRMIIGTSHGLFIMHRPNGTSRLVRGFENMAITAVTIGRPDELWIGTATHGLYRLAEDTTHFHEAKGLNENYINSLYYDKEGKLWIGFRSEGFQLYDGRNFITPNQEEYSHDGIRSILVSGDQVWLGTNSSGLVQARYAQILEAPAGLQLAGKIILPIYQDEDGEIWIGTAGMGAYRYSKGKLNRYDRANGLSNDLVLSLAGNNDYIFIGTSFGLNRFNRKKETIDRKYTREDGLINLGVLCLFNDSRNRLWITTRQGGLHRMGKDGRINAIPLPAYLSKSNLISVLEDGNGDMYFGSRGAGMLKIDTLDRITTFHRESAFPADIVYSYYQDPEGDIWMGTEKGLIVRQDGTYRIFNTGSGLLFDVVYRMLEDPTGQVWMSGNIGLQRIPVSELLAAKKTGQSPGALSARLFNAVDGMPNSETNGGIFPAGWRMQNGQLWFPTAEGVAVIDPVQMREEEKKLGIHLQSLRYGDKEFFSGEKINLPPGVYNFEIRYTSIDFGKPSEIRFFYRLKGLSNEWTPAGTRRIAYYSGLAPGTYTFEVRAERYGASSETVSLRFTVEPQFYQTTWFKIVLGLFLLLVGLWIIWMVRKSSRRKFFEQQQITRAQINGQEKERQLISTELHDSINQQLSTAKMYLDVAGTNEVLRVDLINKSKDVIRNAINEISHLCHSLTPPSLKDIGLQEAIEDLLDPYRAMGRFIIHLEFNLDASTLEEDLQFTLFRITQEQMNNIAEHAEAQNVWIEFTQGSAGIYLQVRDDGKGFDPKTVEYGMGFENMRNRLSLYRGRVEVKTAPGRGCLVGVFVPLGNGKAQQVQE